jgi:hypothetical protein
MNTAKQNNRIEDYTQDGEIWKEIKEYGGKYLVSNDGRIWSTRLNKIVDCAVYKNTYKRFIAFQNNKMTSLYVHRLVAEYFVSGKTQERKVVNHKDCDKLNNNFSNLEWCTQAENAQHWGLLVKPWKTKIVDAYDVYQYERYIGTFRTLEEAGKRTGLTRERVRQRLLNNGIEKNGYEFKKVKVERQYR